MNTEIKPPSHPQMHPSFFMPSYMMPPIFAAAPGMNMIQIDSINDNNNNKTNNAGITLPSLTDNNLQIHNNKKKTKRRSRKRNIDQVGIKNLSAQSLPNKRQKISHNSNNNTRRRYNTRSTTKNKQKNGVEDILSQLNENKSQFPPTSPTVSACDDDEENEERLMAQYAFDTHTSDKDLEPIVIETLKALGEAMARREYFVSGTECHCYLKCLYCGSTAYPPKEKQVPHLQSCMLVMLYRTMTRCAAPSLLAQAFDFSTNEAEQTQNNNMHSNYHHHPNQSHANNTHAINPNYQPTPVVNNGNNHNNNNNNNHNKPHRQNVPIPPIPPIPNLHQQQPQIPTIPKLAGPPISNMPQHTSHPQPLQIPPIPASLPPIPPIPFHQGHNGNTINSNNHRQNNNNGNNGGLQPHPDNDTLSIGPPTFNDSMSMIAPYTRRNSSGSFTLVRSDHCDSFNGFIGPFNSLIISPTIPAPSPNPPITTRGALQPHPDNVSNGDTASIHSTNSNTTSNVDTQSNHSNQSNPNHNNGDNINNNNNNNGGRRSRSGSFTFIPVAFSNPAPDVTGNNNDNNNDNNQSPLPIQNRNGSFGMVSMTSMNGIGGGCMSPMPIISSGTLTSSGYGAFPGSGGMFSNRSNSATSQLLKGFAFGNISIGSITNDDDNNNKTKRDNNNNNKSNDDNISQASDEGSVKTQKIEDD